MTKTRSLGFVAAALVAAGATTAICFGDAIGLVSAHSPPVAAGAVAAIGATARPLETIQNAKPWLTAVPGGPQSLRGKVVVVSFWTYSCINSLRALPYLRAWEARYRDKGFVVLGVHAPEFQFEHDAAKVRLASAQLGVRYPNLQDNDFAVWRDFANQGWPGFYFVDAKGRIRGYRVGEGDYAGSEQLIRKLLAEAGRDPSDIPITPIAGSGIEAAADWNDLESPETYMGYAKAANFLSPSGIRKGVPSSYAQAASLPLNGWDLTGGWTIGGEFATLDRPAGAIRVRFHARDAHLVLGGASHGRAVRFRVTIDGAAPGASHGADINADGWGEVKEDRLYQLVRQTGPIEDKTITVEFTRPGVRAYVFTFG